MRLTELGVRGEGRPKRRLGLGTTAGESCVAVSPGTQGEDYKARLPAGEGGLELREGATPTLAQWIRSTLLCMEAERQSFRRGGGERGLCWRRRGSRQLMSWRWIREEGRGCRAAGGLRTDPEVVNTSSPRFFPDKGL